ncbi:hypothetical protein WR25_04885 [Diploscapter pachys]|uniref:F-box domain-containing protein n=1 Tax=Diploscapter pachys TaxID=2018661 RepID=A0A2A2L1M7_9BILA|nr:hypothetical protein WR25_04885 [Diploscapter pachys]
MILDGLPLELVKEVLLDLPTVDIVQTVKCTRRLYYFAKADKALGRRLQNFVFHFRPRLGKYKPCKDCQEPGLCLDLSAISCQADDWELGGRSNFVFRFEGVCKCSYRDGRMQEIEPGLLDHPSFLYDRHLLRIFENGTDFIIKNDSLDEAIINCGKLINILTKFFVVDNFELDLSDSGYKLWGKMNAFFSANPPDLRIQPCVFANSRINLDDFLTGSIFSNGLARIEIFGSAEQRGLVDAYHEVFRRTPSVRFYEMDLPYTYEDLVGFFKDAKVLKFQSTSHITKQQICQLVQHFYEVKHDEECTFEIKVNESFLVKDLLTLIPEESYKLHLKRSGNIGPEPENMIWAEMTDRFGGAWALMEMGMYDMWDKGKNMLHICSMEYSIESELIELSDQSDSDQSYSDQSDSDQSYSDQSDSDQSYSRESYSDHSDFD